MCSLKKCLGCWVVLNKMFSLKKKENKKQAASQGMLLTNTWVPQKAPGLSEPSLESSSSAVVVSSGTGRCAALRAWLHSQQFVNQCHYPAAEPWAGASAWLQPILELSKLTHRASPLTQPALYFIDMCLVPCLGFEFISAEILLCRKWLVRVPTTTMCHFYLHALSLALTKPCRLWNWRIKK